VCISGILAYTEKLLAVTYFSTDQVYPFLIRVTGLIKVDYLENINTSLTYISDAYCICQVVCIVDMYVTVGLFYPTTIVYIFMA